jgi:cytochrome c-type biogenesis protein CcmH/NrfG
MLFERIRRTQKPIFIVLAIMFGLGFALLGVGSGAGGVNLGDILNSGGSRTSISSLNDKVRAHPNDAPAWLQLARAYQAAGQPDPAIGAYLHYVGLRPKDQGGLASAAAAIEQRALREQRKLTAAQAGAAQYTTSPTSAIGSTKLAGALTNPVLDALARPYTTAEQTLQAQVSADYGQATGLRQKLVALDPKNPAYQFTLAQDAYAGRNYATVVSALTAYLKLEPNLPKAQRTQLRQTISALAPLAKTPSPPATAP